MDLKIQLAEKELEILKKEREILQLKLNIGSNILHEWIEKDIVICDQTYSLNSLHQTFMTWCDNKDYNHKCVHKKELKKALEDLQRKSQYGLIYGNKTSDNTPNGTSRYPKLNFCSKEDLD